MTVLIDADIVAYKASFATEGKDVEDAADAVDVIVGGILEDTQFEPDPDAAEFYLTGYGNFRYDIAVTAPYKGNRERSNKPQWLPEVRQYLQDSYNAKVIDGEEADDAIAIRATAIGHMATIASVDKDFLQVNCWHYNINKRTLTYVTPYEAMFNFYQQILTGDAADNIKGLKGIGPKKSYYILEGAVDEQDMFERVLESYEGNIERIIENGQLLWLRREEDQLWYPPGLG